jgi:hypothetical protein
MTIKFAIVLAVLVLALPAISAKAQGVVRGAEGGSADGAAAAGPVGAIVGGAVGAVTGGVGGLLGIDLRGRFHDYVVREHHASFPFQGPLRPGALLPSEGVTYFPVPPEFGVGPDYRYAIVNDEAVIVDLRTNRIVEVID